MINVNLRKRAREIITGTCTQISYQRDWYNDDNQAKLNFVNTEKFDSALRNTKTCHRKKSEKKSLN